MDYRERREEVGEEGCWPLDQEEEEEKEVDADPHAAAADYLPLHTARLLD